MINGEEFVSIRHCHVLHWTRVRLRDTTTINYKSRQLLEALSSAANLFRQCLDTVRDWIETWRGINADKGTIFPSSSVSQCLLNQKKKSSKYLEFRR